MILSTSANEIKSLIRARFSIGMIDAMDLFDIKQFIAGIERDERRKKIEALQNERDK